MAERTTTDRLLIVAGPPEERATLRRMLGQTRSGTAPGWATQAIETVRTEAEALAALRSGPFSGVILDDRPPLIDALRLMTNWSAALPGPRAVATVVLGDPTAGSRVAEAFRRGAADYLFQGQFTGNDLRRTVQAALDRAAPDPAIPRRSRGEPLVSPVGELNAEEARSRLRLLEMLARTTTEGLAVVDGRGQFIFANPAAAAIFGRDEEGLKEYRLANLPPELGEAGAALSAALGAVAGSDQVRDGVASWPGADRDGPTLVAFSAVPVVVDGVVAGTVLTLRDATEQGRLDREASQRADELIAAGRRKDEFLAMLAHELRTPLAPILNAMRIIGLQGGNDPTQAPIRAMVEQQVRHMTRLIDDLLDMSRVARGTIELRREPTSLAGAVDRAVESTRHLLESRSQSLAVDRPEQVILDADPTRLDQILGNLLTNAAKYTDAGGQIRLAANLDDGFAVIRVADNGIGIAPDFLPRIFDLFAQADPSLDRSRGGLGIGLTLVRDLVDLHGGTIVAASEGVGRGSEFTVRLPHLSAAETPPSEPAPIEIGPAPAVRPVRVLVVDDDISAAQSLAVILDLWGHRATVAHDSASALDQARQARPEVILLDISLPDTDGYQVARQIRAEPDFAPPWILAMTGHAAPRDRQRSAQEGLDGHLVKPVDLDFLEHFLAEIDSR